MGSRSCVVIFLIPILWFLPQSARAQSLSEPAFFNRCYSHLTGHPVPLKSPTMSAIRAGRIKALTACEILLDSVQLGEAGFLTDKSSLDARRVLNNFYNFHRTWFAVNTVEQIQEYNEEMSRGTMDIYDTTEPGLALTRAAFAREGKYSEVLNLKTGVHALREEYQAVRRAIGWSVSYPMRLRFGNNAGFDENLFNFRALSGSFDGNSDTTTSVFKNIPKIEVGELVGIRPKAESITIPNLSLQPLGGDKRGNEQPGLNFEFDLYRTFGGGVLGTPIYFMLNYGHGRGLEANGTTKVPRRWAQTNLNSFLCAELPALREADIRKYVLTNSGTPFRNSASCVMCHATLDSMAYSARNLIVGNSDYFVISAGSKTHAKTALHVTSYRPEIPSVEGWPSEPVVNFHRQIPTGRLFFRSMTGELIDKPLNGIDSLGQAMSQTKDFYYCAAKRYFDYFTGINVSMFDRTNPANAEMNQKLSKESEEHRKFIEDLGDELQKNQSVKTMIKSIMASKYYRMVNFREN
jgi:hypothetical protein